MTFAMNYKITVGKYRVQMLDSLTITKSVENLADTATIVIPGTYINRALKIEDKIQTGDAVEIYLGYDDNLLLEFTGYLNDISTDDAAIRLECMDALYLFKKSLKDKEYKVVSVKTLLTNICNEINATNRAAGTATAYKTACNYDFSYEKFVLYKATGLDVLKKVQDETKANIYFEGETLHIHPPYSQIKNGKPVAFDFARNIEKADLKYVRAADKKVEVEVTIVLPNGKTEKTQYGTPGGEKHSVKTVNIDKASMKNRAKSEYNLWVYDGYEGSFTGWLIPYVEPAYKISLHDSEYEYKNGNYYVIATETSFSSSGGVRKITLGRKIGD